ncbi:heterodisulfide reductase-related iron-sulfur binding cluster, partial [Methanosarcina mazei]
RTLTCGMGFSQLHLNKNTSLQVTKTKLDSLQRAGVELMIHMCPNCHIHTTATSLLLKKSLGKNTTWYT